MNVAGAARRERRERIRCVHTPGDGQHIELSLQRLIQGGTGGELARCVLPQTHVQRQLELAAHIGDEASGVGAQIDDATAGRDACPEVEARAAIERRIARRPLDASAREQAVPLARMHMHAGSTPRRLIGR